MLIGCSPWLMFWENNSGMPVISNREFNAAYLKGQPFRRRGSCRDCAGACCRFVAVGPLPESQIPYFARHGTLVQDRWLLDYEYVVIAADCSSCTMGGQCVEFGRSSMPEECKVFPCTPFDPVWRYLVQIGQPCGFEFVDRETGKKWGMRRKDLGRQ